MNEIMRNWRIPAVILLLLILAMTFRWNIDKNTSGTGSSTIVSKYKTDRWNGSVYHEVLTNSRLNTFMIQDPMISANFATSRNLTLMWSIATGGSVIWLLYALSKPKKKDVKDNLTQ